MIIRRIDLADDSLPRSVWVQMSAQEAAYIAVVLGRMTGIEATAICPKGTELNYEALHCLTGELFNHYWEDGLRDAAIELIQRDPDA